MLASVRHTARAAAAARPRITKAGVAAMIALKWHFPIAAASRGAGCGAVPAANRL
ncbi:hypothetical protein BV133_1524 [Blastochloris viridis]|uniref:Uncharacterized protein n=1 Tax=Blastochloris viridis TaxID=1079 RepID=A0A182D2A9_BLAVI|nr:hypothetical protein BV133_1524 [Blastochloris viridis]